MSSDSGDIEFPLGRLLEPHQSPPARDAGCSPCVVLVLGKGFVTAPVLTPGYPLCFAQELTIKEIVVAKAKKKKNLKNRWIALTSLYLLLWGSSHRMALGGVMATLVRSTGLVFFAILVKFLTFGDL